MIIDGLQCGHFDRGAFQSLQKAGVGTGSRVLVIGAGGGVGSFAVQIAVALGATVTGMCSAGKSDLVRSLGATEILDYAVDEVDRVVAAVRRSVRS